MLPIKDLTAEVAPVLAQELGLKLAEYEHVVEILKRTPTVTELYMYSLMWSEHCSYKHSKKYLSLFPTTGEYVLQGPGENAGVISVGDGWAIAFKMESHNHPSAIEPYEGAATGVGGIIRDIFTMGARPIACLNSLRFGTLDKPRQRYLFEGAVAGIGGYGNCLGVPTVGGEVYFEKAYEGNCLINAMAIGLMREENLILAQASGIGNNIVLIGSTTGRDGIGGASVLASQEFDEGAEAKRPAVQVGDPFEEKVLIEACLELLERKLLVGLGDLGAAGLTSSASEMASRGGVGLDIDVAKIPQRETEMKPFEIMVSESQERMLAVVTPEKLQEVLDVCHRWGLLSTVIGEVTDTGNFVVRQGDEIHADMPALTLADDAPMYDPAMTKPDYLDELAAVNVSTSQSGEPTAPSAPVLGQSSASPAESRTGTSRYALSPLIHPETQEEVTATLLKMLGSANISSRQWIYRQYDHQVQNNTVVLPGSDAAVIRIGDTGRGEMTDRAIAVSSDCNGRYVYLNPYRGAQIALAEAARNVTCAGGQPAAITDCLNFGNPEKPEVYWTFHAAVSGLAEGCKAFGIPVISGNVSFYNESFGKAIYPTPVVGLVGLLDSIDERCTMDFKNTDDVIILVGETEDELGGSEYLNVTHGLVAGEIPALDLELEVDVQNVVRNLIRKDLAKSAHDCSEGGIAVALAESAIAGGVGCAVMLDDDLAPVASLFSETQSRIVITCASEDATHVVGYLTDANVPFSVIGEVGGNRVRIEKVTQAGGSDGTEEAFEMVVDVPLSQCDEIWSHALEHMVEGL